MKRSLRMWSPRRRIRVRRRGSGLLLAAAVGIGLALLVIFLVDAALRPAVTTLATVQAQNKITGIVNDAVSATLADQGIAYADLVTVERDESGKVSLLAVDSVKLNTLRAQILEEVLEQVEGLDAQELGVSSSFPPFSSRVSADSPFRFLTPLPQTVRLKRLFRSPASPPL